MVSGPEWAGEAGKSDLDPRMGLDGNAPLRESLKPGTHGEGYIGIQHGKMRGSKRKKAERHKAKKEAVQRQGSQRGSKQGSGKETKRKEAIGKHAKGWGKT